LITTNYQRLKEPLILTALFVVGTTIYLIKQFSTPLLFYIDGPYYYVQVKSILSTNTLKYPDPPLTFYLLTIFSIIFSDIMYGVKIGSTILIMLGIYPLYYLVREMSDSKTGYIVVLLYIISPALMRLSLDFIKNSIGLTFVYTSFYSLLKGVGDHRYRYLLFLSIILTGLTHILDFSVLLLVIMFFSFIIYYREHYIPRYIMYTIALLALLLIGGSISTHLMGGDPNKALSLIKNLNIHPIEPRLLGSFFYVLIILLTSIYFLYRESWGHVRYFMYALILTLSILIIPIYPWDYTMRFLLEATILAYIPIGYLIGRIKNSSKILIGILLITFTIPGFINQWIEAKPSISLEEYYEIKDLINKTDQNIVFVIHDPRLRYWFETLTFNIVDDPKDAPPDKELIIVFDRPIRHPLPPGSRLVYNGKFIHAYHIPHSPLYDKMSS